MARKKKYRKPNVRGGGSEKHIRFSRDWLPLKYPTIYFTADSGPLCHQVYHYSSDRRLLQYCNSHSEDLDHTTRSNSSPNFSEQTKIPSKDSIAIPIPLFIMEVSRLCATDNGQLNSAAGSLSKHHSCHHPDLCSTFKRRKIFSHVKPFP